MLIGMFFLVALLCVLAENKKKPNSIYLLCIFFMAIFSAFREMGGSDYYIYKNFYAECPDSVFTALHLSENSYNFEKGFLVICSFFKMLNFSFYGFCVIHAAFFYFSLWFTLRKYTPHFGFVILFFLYKLFYYNTFISMRQSITIAAFFLMIPLIQNRKWFKYFICAFFVSKIHNGAYLLFPLYFLTYIHWTKKLILALNVIFIPTIFLGFANVDVLGPIGDILASTSISETESHKIDSYFNNENISPIGLFHTLEYFLLMFLFIMNIDRINLKNQFVQTSVSMFMCLLPLFTLFRGSEILTREKDYFTIFYAVILGYIVDCTRNKNKNMVTAFVVLLCTFGFIRFTILFDDGVFLNYKTWLTSQGAPLYIF